MVSGAPRSRFGVANFSDDGYFVDTATEVDGSSAINEWRLAAAAEIDHLDIFNQRGFIVSCFIHDFGFYFSMKDDALISAFSRKKQPKIRKSESMFYRQIFLIH